MAITFYAKNLVGQIKELVYNNIDEIPNLLTESFGSTPLYEPIWMDEDGYENFPPKNLETVFVLYRYINIPVSFVNNWMCIDEDTGRSYTDYSIIIESNSMQNLFEEIVIDFNKDNNEDIFYSEREKILTLREEYGSLVRYIEFPDTENTVNFSSIKEMFLSFSDIYNNIPEDFFKHISMCVEKQWKQERRVRYREPGTRL